MTKVELEVALREACRLLDETKEDLSWRGNDDLLEEIHEFIRSVEK